MRPEDRHQTCSLGWKLYVSQINPSWVLGFLCCQKVVKWYALKIWGLADSVSIFSFRSVLAFFLFFFLFCESWERWHSLSVFPLCWIALRWITNKRPRNTVKISFHCLCSDFPFIAKIQHPFPALNVMHTIALLSVWKPNLTGGGGIKDQITSSVCKTVQSEASVFSRAIQNRLIRQDCILRLHCLPA